MFSFMSSTCSDACPLRARLRPGAGDSVISKTSNSAFTELQSWWEKSVEFRKWSVEKEIKIKCSAQSGGLPNPDAVREGLLEATSELATGWEQESANGRSGGPGGSRC